MTRSPPTLATLLQRLMAMGVDLSEDRALESTGAGDVARAIRVKALESVQCAGRMNFARYYEAVFGVTLDGKSLTKGRRRA